MMYFNTKPHSQQRLNDYGRLRYIEDYRTLSYDGGRQSGKTSNICELIVRHKFDNVLYVIHKNKMAYNTQKRIDNWKSVVGLSSYENNIKFTSYLTAMRDMEGFRKENPNTDFDLIVF